MKKIYWIVFLFALISCAGARKIKYNGINADLPKSSGTVAIAAWDQRIQVTDGSRKPDFVGYMRSGAGIAYPMKTRSGKPFAMDMTSTIAAALQESGSKVTAIQSKHDDSKNMVFNKLKESGSSRLVLLKCNEYHTDGYGAQTLIYDIDVMVYDLDGNIVSERKFSGKRSLGGNGFWGAGKYKVYMPAAYKKLIEEIFSDKDLALAFK